MVIVDELEMKLQQNISKTMVALDDLEMKLQQNISKDELIEHIITWKKNFSSCTKVGRLFYAINHF